MQKSFSIVSQNTLNHKIRETKEISKQKDLELIKEVIKNANELRDQLIVIKLPLLIIEDSNLLTNFANIIHLLHLCGTKIFIIHDHIDFKSDTFKHIGLTSEIIDIVESNEGLLNIQLTEMVTGYINKYIVSKLCEVGCLAIGISCKDTNLIQAKKSKLSSTIVNSVGFAYKERGAKPIYNRGEMSDDVGKFKSIDYTKFQSNQSIIDIGFINEPLIINPEILLNFENNNIVSIISPIANDEQGNTQLLDVNLTLIEITSVLVADHLIFLCNKSSSSQGALKIQDVSTLKSMLNANDFIKKDLITTAIKAIENNIENIHFINASSPDLILSSMLDNEKNNKVLWQEN